SASVTEGHPDKVADQVSDTVLDAVLADDPGGRVACETLITTGLVVVAGEISTETYVDIPAKVRGKIAEIGYTHSEWGFDATTCGVVVAIDEQSPDIAQGIDASYEVQHDRGDDDPLDRVGAGDQGMMFGYATRGTAVALFQARTRPRSTAPPPTRPATSRRTSSRRGSRTAARSTSRTRSGSHTRFRSGYRRSVPRRPGSRPSGSRNWSARTS